MSTRPLSMAKACDRCTDACPVSLWLSSLGSPRELSFKESKFLPSHLSAKILFPLVNRKRRKTKSHPSFFWTDYFPFETDELPTVRPSYFVQTVKDLSMGGKNTETTFCWDFFFKLNSVFLQNVAVHHSSLTEELSENITIFTHHIPNVTPYFMCLQGTSLYFGIYTQNTCGKDPRSGVGHLLCCTECTHTALCCYCQGSPHWGAAQS